MAALATGKWVGGFDCKHQLVKLNKTLAHVHVYVTSKTLLAYLCLHCHLDIVPQIALHRAVACSLGELHT